MHTHYMNHIHIVIYENVCIYIYIVSIETAWNTRTKQYDIYNKDSQLLLAVSNIINLYIKHFKINNI